jgi:hypothetical protein
MTNTKHTQGPWHTGKNGQPLDEFGNAILPARADLSYKNGVAREANARLIAAAPDLLEALEEIAAQIETIYVNNPTRELFDVLEQARVAINKARGEA